MIPIQILAREGFIGEQGNLVGELRKLLKRFAKLTWAEVLKSGGNVDRLFEQRRGLGAGINAMCSSLTA